MGASSVTGVSGYGTVAGAQKGSEHMSLGVEKLIGPRHVYVGVVTLASAAASIQVHLPTSNVADYVIQLTDQTANHSAGVTAFAIDSTTLEATIAIAGTGTDVIAVSIVKVGYAGAFVRDGNYTN